MQRIHVNVLALAPALFLLTACGPEGPDTGTVEVTPAPVTLAPSPAFNADSAYAFVAKQVSFGPRVPGTPAHRACGDWMVAKLKAYGATVVEQTGTVTAYNGQPVPLRNIIASWQPGKKDRLLLFTHWDTRPVADRDTQRRNDPIAGANDGGSGTAVWLEVARHLSEQPTALGIDIFFTDVEDMGEPAGAMGGDDANSERTWCLGSQYWVKNPHVTGYKARYGILLDMVGSADAQFPREAFSMRFAPQIVNKVWKAAAAVGHGDRFLSETRQYVGIDDHVIVNEGLGIPSIDIIAFDASTNGFPPTWHTHADDLSGIDKESLQAVGATVTQVVWAEK